MGNTSVSLYGEEKKEKEDGDGESWLQTKHES